MSFSAKLGLVFFASEVLLTITRRSRTKTGAKQDKSTLGMIWVVIVLSIVAGVFISGSRSLRAGWIGLFDFPESDWIPILAVAFFAAGLVLRWWAIVTLGRFFTVDVVIEKDHDVVQRGPFRWVRHPSYTGVLLVPIFVAFLRRMKVEETALSQALGERYQEYMKRTKRLVPLIY